MGVSTNSDKVLFTSKPLHTTVKYNNLCGFKLDVDLTWSEMGQFSKRILRLRNCRNLRGWITGNELVVKNRSMSR